MKLIRPALLLALCCVVWLAIATRDRNAGADTGDPGASRGIVGSLEPGLSVHGHWYADFDGYEPLSENNTKLVRVHGDEYECSVRIEHQGQFIRGCVIRFSLADRIVSGVRVIVTRYKDVGPDHYYDLTSFWGQLEASTSLESGRTRMVLNCAVIGKDTVNPYSVRLEYSGFVEQP